jgi:hypothetical protein
MEKIATLKYPKKPKEVEDLKSHWVDLMNKDFYYQPKRVWDGYVKIREWELEKLAGDYLFTEWMIGKGYKVSDERVLYKIYIAHDFIDLYTRVKTSFPGEEPFYEYKIPVNDFKEVKDTRAVIQAHNAEAIETSFDWQQPDIKPDYTKKLEDEHLNDKTHRDDICERYLYPGTNKKWLNELIIAIRRDQEMSKNKVIL